MTLFLKVIGVYVAVYFSLEKVFKLVLFYFLLMLETFEFFFFSFLLLKILNA